MDTGDDPSVEQLEQMLHPDPAEAGPVSFELVQPDPAEAGPVSGDGLPAIAPTPRRPTTLPPGGSNSAAASATRGPTGPCTHPAVAWSTA